MFRYEMVKNKIQNTRQIDRDRERFIKRGGEVRERDIVSDNDRDRNKNK